MSDYLIYVVVSNVGYNSFDAKKSINYYPEFGADHSEAKKGREPTRPVFYFAAVQNAAGTRPPSTSRFWPVI